MAQILTIDSSNVIELTGLKSRVTGKYLVASVIDGDLYAADGTTTIAGAQNIVLALVTSTLTGTSRTMYRGVIAYTVVITDGVSYILKVTADEGGFRRVFRIPCIGKHG